MKTFDTLIGYNKYLNLSPPAHPLMDSRVCREAIPNFPMSSEEIQVNLFKIALKKNFTGNIRYGKNNYNTQNGLMLFSEPGQVVSWDTLTFWDGYAFVFHPDIFKQHPVAAKISRYRYFSYDVADALFMTESEAETITWLFTRIHLELQNAKAKANVDVILSLLDTVLSYAGAYYQRQFGEEANGSQGISAKVKLQLQEHYNNLSKPTGKVPSVSSIAGKLNLSPGHLTKLIKEETGRSTASLIHEYVTDQAQILLVQTDMNVSDIAYRLGFENVQYFSRLFKKIKGFTPVGVRQNGKV